jgi:SRSO17 transposase
MHLKYLIYSSRGELLAATGWSSSVWKLKSRDLSIGWSVPERQRFLGSVANNSRFVIFPWVKIPHLASHLLARQIGRVKKDWERKYGVKLHLLETFVDPSRFRGTSYRAANWIWVGRTQGYAKTRNGFEYHGQTKEVYVYPLSTNLSEAFGLQHHPEIAVDHQYQKTLAQVEERRAQMAIAKAGWNTKVAPSFAVDEDDLSKLVKAFGEYYVLFRDCFGRVEHEEHSRVYLQGLLSSLERKSMEPIALSLLGESRVKALQKFVNTGVWDAEVLGNRHRQEAAKTVSKPGGVYSVDGSDFPKKGTESVGVARQYCGRLGKVDNCQAGVFVAYASEEGHALLDRRLFLPEKWFDKEHEERREKCRIPEGTTFKTKPQLALEMILALHREGLFDARWVTGDDFFGRNPTFRDGLPKDLLYLLDIPSDTRVWTKRPEVVIPQPSAKGGRPKKTRLKKGEPAAILVSALVKDPSLRWRTVTVAEGAQGPIRAEIARIRIVASRDGLPGEDLWLFVRRSLADGEVKYALCNAPEDIALEEMIRVSVLRWPIEQCFQEGKGEIGMDHYEHRSWDAWHRHMTFVFMAQLFLLRVRHLLKKKLQP